MQMLIPPTWRTQARKMDEDPDFAGIAIGVSSIVRGCFKNRFGGVGGTGSHLGWHFRIYVGSRLTFKLGWHLCWFWGSRFYCIFGWRLGGQIGYRWLLHRGSLGGLWHCARV